MNINDLSVEELERLLKEKKEQIKKDSDHRVKLGRMKKLIGVVDDITMHVASKLDEWHRLGVDIVNLESKRKSVWEQYIKSKDKLELANRVVKRFEMAETVEESDLTAAVVNIMNFGTMKQEINNAN